MQQLPHGLGRLYAPDDRDRAHPFMAHLLVAAPLPKYKYWQRKAGVLNQGDEPECVGYAGRQWMNTSPTMTPMYIGPTATQLYKRCQFLDEWPGENYPGTSVRALFKVFQEQGRIGEYIWADTIDSLITWLLLKGPIIVGTDWDWNMFYPDKKGIVTPGGGTAGGHAYELDGINTSTKLVRCTNSWGLSFGIKGRFYLRLNDLEDLVFSRRGEAVTAVERKT